jgi:hypothetical protein
MGCVILVGAVVVFRFDEKGAIARCKDRSGRQDIDSAPWEAAALLSETSGAHSIQSHEPSQSGRAMHRDSMSELSAVLTQPRPAHRSSGS